MSARSAGSTATLQVHAHAAAMPLVQRHPIAQRLRRQQRAEADVHARNHRIVGIVRGDLQHDARVRAAFMQLPGRMQEARAETDGRRDSMRIANLHAQLSEQRRMRLVARDVGGDGVVVVRTQLARRVRRALAPGFRCGNGATSGEIGHVEGRPLDVGLRLVEAAVLRVLLEQRDGVDPSTPARWADRRR